MPHGVSILEGRKGNLPTRRVRKRESETGRQQDTPYRRSSPEWSLRMGLVMREVRCKSFGRRNQKIKMYEPVYIPYQKGNDV